MRCTPSVFCVSALIVSLAASAARAFDPPVRVYDFPGSSSYSNLASPRSLTAVGTRVFLVADSFPEGAELWVSDGTPGGTRLIADVGPGSLGGLADDPVQLRPRALVPFGPGVAFAAQGYATTSLWASDGTSEGTRLLSDAYPGQLLQQGGALYFITPPDLASNFEARLYRSDGSAQGTQPVLSSAALNGAQIMRLGDGLLVVTQSAWLRSDGTADGTSEIGPAIAASDITPVANAIYYTIATGHDTDALWRRDADTGASQLVFDPLPGVGPAALSELFEAGGRLYFSAAGGVWTSDGTPAGTQRLAGFDMDHAVAPDGQVAISSQAAVDPGVWMTDGSAAGTRRIDATPASDLVFHGGELFYARGTELWRSDGTPDSAVLIASLAATQYGGISSLVSGSDAVYFAYGQRELWKSDGTTGGTQRVKAIAAGPILGGPGDLRTIGDRIVFRTQTMLYGAHRDTPGISPLGDFLVLGKLGGSLVLEDRLPSGRRRLSLSNGTLAGTVAYTDITPNLAYRPGLGTVSGRVVFGHKDASGDQLWVTDGTAAGTVPIAQPLRVVDPSTNLGFSKVAQGRIYFSGDDGGGLGLELWATDTTAAGTRLVADLTPGAASGLSPNTFSLATVGSLGFFRAFTASLGGEVWRADGTAGGTQLVVDVLPGISPSNPVGFDSAGSRVFFSAYESNGAPSLYAVDPDGSGLTLLRHDFNLRSVARGSVIGGSLAIGDRMFATDGSELWVSDGSPEGTVMTREIVPGSRWSLPSQLAEVRGRAVFQACEVAFGCELWTSDGTHAGTRRLADLAPGPYSSSPEQFTLAGDDLYFLASFPDAGRDLYRLALGACGDGALDPLEECDDGNLVSGDGCSASCDRESFFQLSGTASGGALTFVLEGQSFVFSTEAGETSADLLARVALALNASPVLRARGVSVSTEGTRLVTTAGIDAVEISDPGLIGGAVQIPSLEMPLAAALAVAMALAARSLLGARSRGGGRTGNA